MLGAFVLKLRAIAAETLVIRYLQVNTDGADWRYWSKAQESKARHLISLEFQMKSSPFEAPSRTALLGV